MKLTFVSIIKYCSVVFCLNESCEKKDVKKTSWCQAFVPVCSDFKEALNVVWNTATISS